MSNKVLFCATVDSHFSSFHLPVLEWFKSRNWEVHVAANGAMDIPFIDKRFIIPIQRSPFRWQNREAYRQLSSIIRQHDYRIIHCHTPMGGVLARLAARRARLNGTKVVYTAHGFHFHKGSALRNWLLYYPIEKSLAHFTDCLITINNEDYSLAIKHKFKARQIEHVHGVGIDTGRYRPVTQLEKMQLRLKSPYDPGQFLMLYAAEFNKNKNHQLLIRALAGIKDRLPGAKLLLAGQGMLQEECRQLSSQLGVEHMVDYLGYRSDIDQLLALSDAAVSSSLREGLPVNIMEAMSVGLPIIATRNRGHIELVKHQENGFIVQPDQVEQMSEYMLLLGQSFQIRQRMGIRSAEYSRKYDLEQVRQQLTRIYKPYMMQPTINELERLQWSNP